MEKLIDMHMHSTSSDGTDTYLELLEKVKEKQISTIALTDHDNIDSSKEIVKHNCSNLNIYSGVELTAKKSKLCPIKLPDSARIHILGYNIDLDNEQLNKTLEEKRLISIKNIKTYYEMMTSLHSETKLSNELLEKLYSSKTNIGRPQLADLMVEQKIVSSRKEAFEKYLIEAYELAKSKNLTYGLTEEECIKLITDAGGVAILAHPNSLNLSNEDLEQRIKYLTDFGLRGLETTHINLNEEERRFLHNLAIKYNLLESGGTDYHGKGKPDVELATGRNNNVLIKRLSLIDKIPNRYRKN